MKRLLALILVLFFAVTAFAEEEGLTILITAVGDCVIGDMQISPVSHRFRRFLTENNNDYGYFFAAVKDLLEQDDLTLINLEGPITTCTDAEPGQTFYFRGDPEYVNILLAGSVEVANLANNHSHNFGDEGYSETMSLLSEAGIGACGYDDVYYVSVKGVTVGFAGFDRWRSTKEDMVRVVTEAKQNCDLLIVSYHGGIETMYQMAADVREAGQICIDAGADLVVGNHSHVYGGIEIYKGKYIISSLGNFCYGGDAYPNDYTCTIFRQAFTVTEDGTVSDGGIDIIPALISTQTGRNNYQPCVMTDTAKAIKHFNGVLKISNFTASDVKWLEDSFAVQNGLDK